MNSFFTQPIAGDGASARLRCNHDLTVVSLTLISRGQPVIAASD